MFNAARVFALASLPLVLAACAPSGEAVSQQSPLQAERRCFQPDQVNNFRSDRQTVYVKVGHSAVYQLSSSGACPDIDIATRIGLAPTGGASSLCVGDPVTVVTPDRSAVSGTCRARLDRQLTVEEIAALPERLRP